MDKKVFKASEIRYLWKHRGSKNYELKCVKASGSFIKSITFEDVRNGREVSGKLVASPKEGEAYHWPRLQHENLAPLLDIVSINDKVSVHMSIVLEKSLRDIIHEDEFLRAPNCFERKKSYAEDVLWGLDYLHEKCLCLMNLNDANVFIFSQSDKAVIGDFSSLTLAARATKCNFVVPFLYRAPELSNPSNHFNAVAAEMWACGVMMLQIFTGHAISETCGYSELLQRVADLHYGVLVEANRGSFITSNAFISFQIFLSSFLCLEPSERCTANLAAVSDFLQKSHNRGERFYGKLWQFIAPTPEEKIRSFCDSPVMPPWSTLNEVDSYRDNLKIHFPWNKFVNLNYVSNERNESSRQNNQEILNNKTFDKQINQSYHLSFENASMDQIISEKINSAEQTLENTNNTPEITFFFETETNINKLNYATDLSTSSDPTKENFNNEPKQTGIDNECFVDVSPNKIQKCENSLSSPLTGDCIEMKQNDSFFTNTITPTSKSTHTNIVEATTMLSTSSSFSTGDSIGVLRNEIKWDNQEINFNILPEIQKNDSYSDLCGQHYDSDFETESTNPVSESSWMKLEYNQDFLSDTETNFRPKSSFLLDPGVSKHPRFGFYKNSNAEIRRSHSESTITSSTSHSTSVKSDPCMKQHRSNLPNRIQGSQRTVSSDAFLISFNEKEYERTCYAIDSDNKALSFSEVCSAFEAKSQRVENSLKGERGLLLPSKSLTCHPADNNEGQPLLAYKSEIYLEERKPLLFTNYKSEICLNVHKQPVIGQSSSRTDTKLCDGDAKKLDLEINVTEKYCKNGTTKMDYTLQSNNTGSLESEVNILKYNTRSTMKKLGVKTRNEIDRYSLYEDIPRPDGTIKKQLIPLEAGPTTVMDKEYKISRIDSQSIKDVSSKDDGVDSAQTKGSSSKNIEINMDDKMLFESSSFKEISLNSLIEPTEKKTKKKGRRRKSWFYRLCLGCKVYHDDKEVLFAETSGRKG